MSTQKTVTKISKWGNGYGIRVPIDTLQAYQLTDGSEVILSRESNGVKISPHTPSLVDLPLKDIMKGVVPKMLASDKAESFFGSPQGNEVW